MMTDQLIGIDVGGTTIKGVLVDRAGTVLNRFATPSRRGEQAVAEDVVTVARALSDRPLPVGVGIPGQVDSVSGVVRDVVNLGIRWLPLAERVAARLGAPVHVENDVNAAAFGAYAVVRGADGAVTGSAVGVRSETAAEVSLREGLDADGQGRPGSGARPVSGPLVFLNFGTGLAAGIIRSGTIEHGASGAVGEIGHLPVDPNGFPCPCGQQGCLETVASGGAVARLWPSAEPPLPDLIRQARQGQPQAQQVLGMVLHAIGDALQVVAQALDPAVIVLGGGMAKTGRPLVAEIEAELHRREASCRFLENLDISARLRLLPPDLPVGGIGAALAAAGTGVGYDDSHDKLRA